MVEQFAEDFRGEVKQKRAMVRDCSSLDDFLEWIGDRSTVWTRVCQFIDGDERNLALAEIQLIAADGITSAVNQELARITNEHRVHQPQTSDQSELALTT